MKFYPILPVAACGLTLWFSPTLVAQDAAIFTPMPLPPAVTLEQPIAETAPTVHGTSVAAQEYSHGDPSAEEQYLLEIINRARANPTAEGVRLAGTTDPDVRMAYQFFEVDTAAVRTAFAGYPVRPPLAFNAMLIAAAKGHSADMRANNFQGHTGSNGSTFDQRINSAGYTGWTRAGENVAGYARSIWYAHAGFNVDWGVPDLGHRKNIMNFETDKPEFLEIGLGIEDIGSQPPQGQVGRYIVTEVFGRRGTNRYIVGVVYRDANGNGMYDPGEGVRGVRITPSVGDFYAITSASGGYAIPVSATGTINVTATGGPSGLNVPKTVVLGGSNVKVDWVIPAAPAAPSLVLPLRDATTLSSDIAFTWNAPAGTVLRYGFELSNDAGMINKVVNDTTVMATNYLVATVNPNQRYYWRVRAFNDGGWGAYSETRMFTAALSSVDDASSSEAMRLTVSPRPASDRAVVHVSMPRESGATLVLADAIGRSVRTVHDGRLPEGTSTIAVELAAMPAGVYYIHCRTQTGDVTTPLVIAR